MRKRMVAGLLAVGLLLLSGCEMVSVNREKDKAQIVAKIGDVSITKEELYQVAQTDINGQGYDLNFWDDAMASDMRTSVDELLVSYLESYTDQKLVNQVGLLQYPLTEEEEKEAQEQATSYIDFAYLYLGYDKEKPTEYKGDIEKDVDDFFAKQLGTTREGYVEKVRETMRYAKVKDAMTTGVAATEEQIGARYDKDLLAQKTAYKAGTSNYETAITLSSMGDYALYKPSTYVVVKHILLKFNEAEAKRYSDAQDLVDEAQKEYDTVKTAISTANAKITAAQKAATDAQTALELATQNNNAEEMAKQQAALASSNGIITEQTAIVTTQSALLVNLETNIGKEKTKQSDIVKDIQKKYQKKLDDVVTRYQAGESFDKLMEELGEDEGLQGDRRAIGYILGPNDTTYDAQFKAAALALVNRGDLSPVITTSYGFHILYLNYTAQEELDIPYETVQPMVKTQENTTVVNDAWQQQVKQLRKEYNVKTWPKRVTFVKQLHK